MNKYNPNIHHRKSIRLKGYDYSQAGMYFITLCVQNRANIFGKIENGKMILNTLGEITKEEWGKTPEIRKNISLGEYIIMPNHFHAIIHIDYQIKPYYRSTSESPLAPKKELPSNSTGELPFAQKIDLSKSIWQRNYWEHIIRNKNEYNRITRYIINNPIKWNNDKLSGGEGNIVTELQAEYNAEIWMI